MIIQRGRVLRIEGPYVWVACESQQACELCAAGRGCGGGLLGRVLGTRLLEVRAVSGHGEVAAGDSVEIGLEESAVLRGAIITYVLPLLAVLVGVVVGWSIGPPASDGWQLLGVAVGLAVGLTAVRRMSRRVASDRRYQPVVLGRTETA